MKKKILILCGGISKERLISLETGKQVANELKKNKYKVLTCEPNSTLLQKIKLFTKLYLMIKSPIGKAIFSNKKLFMII